MIQVFNLYTNSGDPTDAPRRTAVTGDTTDSRHVRTPQVSITHILRDQRNVHHRCRSASRTPPKISVIVADRCHTSVRTSVPGTQGEQRVVHAKEQRAVHAREQRAVHAREQRAAHAREQHFGWRCEAALTNRVVDLGRGDQQTGTPGVEGSGNTLGAAEQRVTRAAVHRVKARQYG